MRLSYRAGMNNVPPVVARRVGSGFVLALALALGATIAAPAAACTQEEYLTEEQRQSGQYDSRPSEWETQWGGGGPHTHGETSAPTARPAPDAAPVENAPADGGTRARAPAPEASSGNTAAWKRSVERRPAPAPPSPHRNRDVAPAPPVPVSPQQTAVAGAAPRAISAPSPATAAPTPMRAARAGASNRPRVAQGGKMRRAPASRRIAAPAAERPAPVVAPAPAAAAGRLPDPLLPALLAAVVLLAAGTLLVLRRRPPSAGAVVTAAAVVDRADAAVDRADAAVEAELQEILAEERARRELAPPVGPWP